MTLSYLIDHSSISSSLYYFSHKKKVSASIYLAETFQVVCFLSCLKSQRHIFAHPASDFSSRPLFKSSHKCFSFLRQRRTVSCDTGTCFFGKVIIHISCHCIFIYSCQYGQSLIPCITAAPAGRSIHISYQHIRSPPSTSELRRLHRIISRIVQIIQLSKLD